MRLLVCNANTTVAITKLCADAARAAASPGTEIMEATPRFGPAVIATRAENAIAAHGVLDTLADHAGRVDAVVLAVSYDTALEAARAAMPCPVVGMTEAAAMTACLLGGRFGLVTFSAPALYRELLAAYGLAGRLSGIAMIGATATDALDDPDAVDAKVADAAARLAAEGADAVLLAGAAMAGMDRRITTTVPLICGLAAGTRMAEMLVRAGYRKPQAGSYAAPSGRASTGLSGPLAALLRGKGA